MPDDFHHAKAPMWFNEISVFTDIILRSRPIQPGVNHGIGNYVVDPTSANLTQLCLLYTNFMNTTVRSLYFIPSGILCDALDADFFQFS